MLGRQTFYASGFLQITTLCLSKLSLLVLLGRIFTTPRFQMTVKILKIIVYAFWLVDGLLTAFICFPPSQLFVSKEQVACTNQQILDVVSPVPWILTDFAILIAPIPIVRKLQVTTSKRVALYAIISIGIM